MNAFQTTSTIDTYNLIDHFISSRVTERGLDIRTEKAYRLDLELFYEWLFGQTENLDSWKENIEEYLKYLSREKNLCSSTISRKAKVFQYYVSYLNEQKISNHPIFFKEREEFKKNDLEKVSASTILSRVPQEIPDKSRDNTLSKTQVDTFFQAMNREYENLDSDFRRRICLRNQVMMELLFYHQIEISELLKLETIDYDWKTKTLQIQGKKGKNRFLQLFSEHLQNQIEQWLEEHFYFEHNAEFANRMFLSKIGKPLSMKMVILIFDKYRLLAGIEKECTPKDLKASMKRYGQELVMEQYRR